LAAALHAAPPATYLLVDQQEIDSARRKAEKYGWARTGLERLVAAAERALQAPVKLPDRGGQWPHWYSCKRDGAGLVTVSPTEHRCPKCGTVYHGDPYDAVVLGRVHSGYARDVQNLGLAFRFSGRARFAKRAGEILAAYADRYSTYPLHDVNGAERTGGGRVMAQTLDESVWLIPMAWGYSLVRDTLAEPERRRIERDLLLAAANVIRAHRMGIHNIQCWKNSAVGLAGFATGNRELVREAIDDPDRGFRAQMARGVTDDGLWYEGSLGYHHYTMQAIWPLAEAARHAGIDLYSDRMRTLFDAPLALALPDGNTPGFNDSGGGNVTVAGPLYEIAYARWHKPEYGRVAAGTPRNSLEALLYGAESVPSGAMIPAQSVLLRAAGYAMLRSASMTVAARFGMHGGGHGHPDKLNIVTFAAGHLFGLDPGSIAYAVPLHREWYRSTIAHNTVSVDRQLQRNADGRLDRWTTEGSATILVASADDVYAGVTLERTLRLRDGHLLDRFSCASEKQHVYDWAFHSAGRFSSSLEFRPRAAPLGEANGYQHIENVAEARTDGDWWVRWEAEDAQYTLHVKAAPGTEVFTGAGPGKNPADRIPLVIIRRRAKATVYDIEHEIRSIIGSSLSFEGSW
jgi:oligo-alginate lyase